MNRYDKRIRSVDIGVGNGTYKTNANKFVQVNVSLRLVIITSIEVAHTAKAKRNPKANQPKANSQSNK